jgi:hypothetical protein
MKGHVHIIPPDLLISSDESMHVADEIILREPDPYNLGPDSLCQIDHVNK